MIQNKMDLLQGIADGLKDHAHERVENLIVEFEVLDDGDTFDFDVPTAIDYLVNNVHWDERGDWSMADSVRVYCR